MNHRPIITATLATALLLAASAGAWYLLRGRTPAYCQLSGRPIHAHMLTVVRVNGQTRYACCARCALTLQQQTGTRVQILRVTDYISGRAIPAEKAYFVDGSQVEVCSSPRMVSEEERIPYARFFDRCAPSLIAFVDEQQARAFVAQHGGALKQLDELEREITPKGPGVKTP